MVLAGAEHPARKMPVTRQAVIATLRLSCDSKTQGKQSSLKFVVFFTIFLAFVLRAYPFIKFLGTVLPKENRPGFYFLLIEGSQDGPNHSHAVLDWYWDRP